MYREIRQRIQLYLLLWLWLTPAAVTAAQMSLPSVSRFSRLDIQQGLSQNTVTALAQDHAGNMWIGTQNGLNRFDGFAVKVYRPDDKQQHTLTDNFITSLAVDKSGVVWVGTLNGLNRLNPRQGVFTAVRSLPARSSGDDVILSLHLDQQNRLWAGTDRGIALWHEDSQSLRLWADPGQSGGAHQSISAISTDQADTLWFGTPQGLYRYDIASKTRLEIADFPLQHSSVMALYHDTAGQLWVGLEHEGLLLRHSDSPRWQRIALATYGNGVSSKEIRSITMGQNGDIWVGTQHGLNRLSRAHGQWQQQASYYHQRHNPASLGSGKVVSILTDRDGSLWVGTWNGGVSRLSQANNLFASITPDLPLMAAARNPATISLAASHHQLWAGTADGLFELNLRNSSLQQIADQHSSYTYYSALDLGEDIWFGHAQGITRLNKTSGEYRELALPDTMAKGPVRRMWATPEHIWLAIEQYGVVILDRALQQVIGSQPFNRSITFIKPLGQQFVLVGSYNGLSWFDRNSGALLHSHKLGAADSSQIPGLPSAPMDYLASAGQRHWLATNGNGLFEMRSKTNFAHPADVQFVQYAEAQGLASGQLKSMAADQQDNIWLSTAFGISVFTPASAQFRNFGHSHGTLQRDYINASATTLEDGSIAFGGMDGFTLFQPAQVMAYQARSIAVPQIQAIQINGAALQPEPAAADAALARILHAEQQLIIPAGGARSIGFDYSTREFIETNQVQFQYRLDPLDSDWTTRNAHQRSANFERLPPGNYSFRLRAGLPQMGWSDESQLNIKVLPLWWETWQARLLLFALLVVLLLGTHFLRLRQLHKRQQELAWLVEERTRALEESKNKAEQTLQQLASTMKELVRTEKMAALGQLVAGVAHEVNTPLGVALTANSVVTEESLQLQQKLASGNIRRQELEDYLYKLIQAGRLLDHNLQRAAQLVANFKQVSVDRTADNQRQFNLALYLDELLESLSLMWRSRQIVLLVDCPDDIVMDSYPGTIGQIITNLTQNAIVHGFKDRDSGKISLSCARKDNSVQIIFADNGIGINSADLERIFDPFFTTNRHLGGTGLGLHIVFNLITQKLGGSIEVASSPGEGSRFTLLLPLKL